MQTLSLLLNVYVAHSVALAKLGTMDYCLVCLLREDGS